MSLNFKFDLNHLLTKQHEAKERLSKAIDFLNEHLDDPSRVFSQTHSYHAFIFIGKSLRWLDIDLSVFALKEFDAFMAKLMLHFYLIRNELQFCIEIDQTYAEKASNVHEIRMHIFSYSLYITNQINKSSPEFAHKFVLKQGLKVYVSLLSDVNFIKTNADANIQNMNIHLLDYIILNVASLRYTYNELKQIWTELDTVNVLLNIVRINKPVHYVLYTTIAYLIDSSQVENLPELHMFVDILACLLVECHTNFRANQFRRWSGKIHFKGKHIDCQIHCILKGDNLNSGLVGMRNILESVTKLSVNNSIRNEIYFDKCIKSYLNMFLAKGIFKNNKCIPMN